MSTTRTVELQKLVTVIVKNNETVIQPIEDWIDAEGAPMAEITVEVFGIGYVGASAPTNGLVLKFETAPGSSSLEGSSRTPWLGAVADTTLSTPPAGMSITNLQTVREDGTYKSLRRFLRWAIRNSDSSVTQAVTFRVTLLLHFD
jgi:hypothetical protein